MTEKFHGIYRTQTFRLKEHDYSADGYYFVTICVYNHECLLGTIKEGIMSLNPLGVVADRFWRAIPDHFPFVIPDKYVIMSNHVHGIIHIDAQNGVRRIRV